MGENIVRHLLQWHSVPLGLLIFAWTGYAPAVSTAEVEDVAALRTSQTADFDRLRDFLEARGWRVERAADGSIILIPMGETAQTGAQAVPARPPAPATPDEVERLRDALEVYGWRVERDAAGSLFLMPATSPTPQQPLSAGPPASANLTVSPEHMSQLLRLLEACHWNLIRDEGNRLRLSPPTHTRALSPPASAGISPGERLDFPITAGVELPVDTRKEAWQISANWLHESGYEGLTARNIRDRYWIYLVTIVDEQWPYRPRGQLIINKRTGQLFSSF